MHFDSGTVTPFYTAIVALIFVALSVRTLLLRRRFQVAVGHGNEPLLERATRVHANFAEYVPIALLLIFFVELSGGSVYLVHALCLALIVGRLSHAFGVSQTRENFVFRVFGMAMTFTAILSAAGRLLLAYL